MEVSIMQKLLEGKTAIITGGSMGIGGETAELFAREGASVVITARGEKALNDMVDKIRQNGGNALGIVSDVGSAMDCKKVFAAAIKEFGQVDILVNNAGIVDLYSIETTTDDGWEIVVAINQNGVFYYCREAIQHMLPRMQGAIVNVTSMNGIRPLCGFSYSVSKTAANAITRFIALRFAGTGIRCNAVAPGPTITPMNNKYTPGVNTDEHVLEFMKKRCDYSIPYSDAIDQANAILFLASDLAKSINGTIIEVDKGSYI
jgi:NAD(P)-dependent dehydrogenase (short-subunit alcohol dehydrogenase family)